jgi:VanZ family protein
MAAVLLLAAQGIGKVNAVPPIVHKLEHFLYYGGMAALLAFGVGRRRLWIPLLVVPLVGVVDEWHQFFTPGRNSSALDWTVDLLGVGVAVYVYYRWVAARGGRKEER